MLLLCIISKYITNENDIINEKNIKIDKSVISNNDQSGVSQNLMLINKDNKLEATFYPNDLVVPAIRFGSVGDMMVQYVKTDVAKSLEKMFKDAKNDGIQLIAISGFRSYEYQNTIFNNEAANVGEIEANRYVAKAGESEHQAGLAMDILCDKYLSLDEGFEDTDAFLWLEKNMTKYGFILRYPKNKEEVTGYGYEAWHLRYVGVDYAKNIMESRLTLEEYLD